MRFRGLLVSALIVSTVTLSASGVVYSEKSAGVILPVLVERTRVRYTQEAWDRRIEGSVMLDCDVMPDGTVGAVLVTGTTMNPTYGLDEQAIKSVSEWKFRPGMMDGKPVAVRVSIQTKFTLARSPR